MSGKWYYLGTSGANSSYGYRISSSVSGDRTVSRAILNAMMEGESLWTATNKVRAMYPDYAPISTQNLVLGGNVNTRINDTYEIKDVEILNIPDSYVLRDTIEEFVIYQLQYNGYWATDKIVYDNQRQRYCVKRNKIEVDTLQNIDFALVEENKILLDSLYDTSNYQNYVEYITVVNNSPTVIRIYSKEIEGILEYDCFDLQTNEIINDSIDLFEDIF